MKQILLFFLLLSAPVFCSETPADADGRTSMDDYARESAELKKQFLADLRTCASEGFLIRKNGEVIFGTFSDLKKDKISFRSENGEMLFFSTDDALNLPRAKLLEFGRLAKVRRDLNVLQTALEKNDFLRAGSARKEAKKTIAKLAPDARNEWDSCEKMKNEIKTLSDKLDSELETRGLVFYKNGLQDKKELAGHLRAKHIFFRETYWILPSQICLKCKGKGSFACSRCAGKGVFSHPCGRCSGKGYLTCSLCSGTGKKPCSTCGSSGIIRELCPTCGGTKLVQIYVLSAPEEILTEKCPKCKASGFLDKKCGVCRGRGFTACPIREECPDCRGKGKISGVCEKCRGTKTEICPDCRGEGFLGPLPH